MLDTIKKEKEILYEALKKKSSTIETLKQAANKIKLMKNWTMSESFLTKENKIKELSVELRQQRAKNRQLKSELISLQENIKTSEEENMATNESKAVRIKINF